MTAPQEGETPVQEAINAYWNLRSASYDAEAGHAIRDEAEVAAWTADLLPLLPPAPADALDVGCGTGFLANLLARLGYRVIGVDAAAKMLDAARARSAGLTAPPAFVEGDAHAPPLPAESLDIVANRHVLWTLQDPPRAFAAWRRLLRPGGRVLIIDSLWAFGDAQQNPRPGATPWAEAWARLYSPEVRAALPMMDARSLDPALEQLRAASFVEVTVTRLSAVEAYERAHPTEWYKGDEPRYAITAARPRSGA